MATQLRLVVDNTAAPSTGTGGATISPCGHYRYTLWRAGFHQDLSVRKVLFVMLNPSTADALVDDPTIRKCRGFAERWGSWRFDVANLFAWRATDPKELKVAQQSGQDIVGPENGGHLAALATQASRIVVAWGAHAKRWEPYTRTVARSLFTNHRGPLFCLGRTSGGFPRHPLMLAYDTPLELWEVSP